MLLSIIVVSYNTSDLTHQAIESALADIHQSSLLKRQAEIIVIDNNSSDDSLKMLRKLAKESKVSMIANRENLGFAAANNQGLERARGKYLLLLNSDTIVQAGTLETMVATFEEAQDNLQTAVTVADRGRLDHLGILAAELLNADGTLQPQGGSFPTLFTLAGQMLMLDDLPLVGRMIPSTQHTGRRTVPKTTQAEVDALEQKDWVGGTAMMIRRETLDEVGLLDPNIFMYAEDVELCMRARDHHWDVAVHPRASVIHLGSASSSPGRAIVGEAKGYVYIWSKHKPLWQVPLAKLLIKTGALVRLFVFGTIKPDASKRAAYRQIIREL